MGSISPMMPNMQNAINRFNQTMQFTIVIKEVVDHQVVESSKVKPVLWFEGTLIPAKPRELLVKTEGERKWKHWVLYTNLVLQVDNIIKDVNGILYRVMASSDWTQAGFIEYQLVEGPGVDE